MKNNRQRAILEIVASQPVKTQEQLMEELRRRGFRVTQATVSRDVKELGLVKIPEGRGTYRYGLAADNPLGDAQVRLRRLFSDSVIGVEHNESLIVIRTLPGSAHAVASCIDYVSWPDIIGTVAGDDTILVIVKSCGVTRNVFHRFQELLG